MAYRIADGLGGPLHTPDRRRRGRAGMGGIRAPTAQLSADEWSVTGDPYLVLDVPAADLPSLAAGFETALDGVVPDVANADARIERHTDTVVLVLCGHEYTTAVPFDGWPESGECQIIVVGAGVLPEPGRRREAALVDVINAGHALVAVNEITVARRSPGR